MGYNREIIVRGLLDMQLGWIDFSKSDRDKVLDVINLLQEQGAVDELGVGVIRDAFANCFFPGTSTVQTRAKYFLIVPYVIKEAADGKYGSDIRTVMKRFDNEEKNCGIILKENCPNELGVIGARVLPRSWVARKPSNIYWNGIRTYKIFTDDSLSMTQFIQLSLQQKGQKVSTRSLGNRNDNTDDEKDDVDAGDSLQLPHIVLPEEFDENWRDNLTIDLTYEEACFLRKQIEQNVPDSLMAYVLKNNIDISRYDGFKSFAEEHKDNVSPDMKEKMVLACDFIDLVYLAMLRYNYILSEGQNKMVIDEWDVYKGNLTKLSALDLEKIYHIFGINNFRLRKFLNTLRGMFIDKDIDSADKLIIDREIQHKGINRAKLLHTDQYDEETWVGMSILDYRLSSAVRIINDIYAGEVA